MTVVATVGPPWPMNVYRTQVVAEDIIHWTVWVPRSATDGLYQESEFEMPWQALDGRPPARHVSTILVVWEKHSSSGAAAHRAWAGYSAHG